MRRIFVALIALLVPAVSVAQTADDRPCMSRQGIDALITVALPDMVRAARLVCRKTLPSSAFLRRDLDELERRLRAEAIFDMGIANSALRRMSDRPIPEFFFATLRQMAGLTPFYRLLSRKDADQCATMDELLSNPEARSGREVAATPRELSITAVEDAELPSYRLCPPVTP